MKRMVMVPAIIIVTLLTACSFSVQCSVGGRALSEDDVDERVRAFVEEAIPAIFDPPSFAVLLSYSAPELEDFQGMDELFRTATDTVGPLEEFEIENVVVVEVNVLGGERIPVAIYRVRALFKSGPGVIELQVAKRDNVLQILSWRIESDAFLGGGGT